MADMISTKIIVPGQAEGVVLKLQAPLSFWGGVNPKTGVIIQADHPDCGTSITNTILALPGLIGSSSSSAILLELLYKEIAPKAILMAEVDAILALGDLVAKEMGYPTISILQTPIDPLVTGLTVVIDNQGILKF
jgi:predicted aconitase with swiveling domain|tara:strand:+ start:1826 stop:2230 length:405 start_codon:yes stop_codon:yes gene_type:complete